MNAPYKNLKDVTKLAYKHGRPNYSGNTQKGRVDNELVRLGFTIDDIPKQLSFEGKYFLDYYKYKKNTKIKPKIKHDNGFTYDPKEKYTNIDVLQRIKWEYIVLGAEALRPDLIDGLGAYRHFLSGRGTERTFSYERYVASDISGRKTLENAIMHLKLGIEGIW
ncbi:hypothetical protein L4C36_22195, partial [Photobacterium japonica]|uniref:hypothetical protein n=1 Tax=Photobacterium japonica TaxID=2910235 RepID=UPI003D0B7EAA